MIGNQVSKTMFSPIFCLVQHSKIQKEKSQSLGMSWEVPHREVACVLWLHLALIQRWSRREQNPHSAVAEWRATPLVEKVTLMAQKSK